MTALVNRDTGDTLAKNVVFCDSFFPRLKGLLGKSRLGPEEAYLIIPCRSVHTLGMKFPIDVYFLDRENRVVGIEKALMPNRLSGMHAGTHSVIEFAVGDRPCLVGNILSFKES